MPYFIQAKAVKAKKKGQRWRAQSAKRVRLPNSAAKGQSGMKGQDQRGEVAN